MVNENKIVHQRVRKVAGCNNVFVIPDVLADMFKLDKLKRYTLVIREEGGDEQDEVKP